VFNNGLMHAHTHHTYINTPQTQINCQDNGDIQMCDFACEFVGGFWFTGEACVQI